jgi:hypothetical protein
VTRAPQRVLVRGVGVLLGGARLSLGRRSVLRGVAASQALAELADPFFGSVFGPLGQRLSGHFDWPSLGRAATRDRRWRPGLASH